MWMLLLLPRLIFHQVLSKLNEDALYGLAAIASGEIVTPPLPTLFVVPSPPPSLFDLLSMFLPLPSSVSSLSQFALTRSLHFLQLARELQKQAGLSMEVGEH